MAKKSKNEQHALGQLTKSGNKTSRVRSAAHPDDANVRKFDARPDFVDFRDQMYIPTLIEVPPERPLKEYLKVEVPVLDQGQEGACTGFGLATVAHYLLKSRKIHPDTDPVSPRMFYEMARRYDEWEGSDYSGSSARGAMKGWHKHGVCSAKQWPYDAAQPAGTLTDPRAKNAATRPLGAYFRVNHRDLTAMHCALAEVGVLFVTAIVHAGWNQDQMEGKSVVGYDGSQEILGGHAFALVGYDEKGFWLQNSWGPNWAKNGFAQLTYDDWLAHGTDAWVARLGVPVAVHSGSGVAVVNSGLAASSTFSAYSQIRPHVISIGENGKLKKTGTYATSEEDVRHIVEEDIKNEINAWPKKRLLLYAPGGLTSEASAIQRTADYRGPLLKNEIYPLVFSWNSDYWSTLQNILQDALRGRTSGSFIDAAKDFMLDRLDDALEPIARALSGKLAWEKMKENATNATTLAEGGLRHTATSINQLCDDVPGIELHLTGHSAGSIVLASLAQLLSTKGTIGDGPLKGVVGYGRKIKTCTLWAPACTVSLFVDTFVEALESGQIEKLKIFLLSDPVEQADNCNKIYNKSLLYLVAHAFENPARDYFQHRFGTPLLGMARSFHFTARELEFLTPQDKAAVLKLQSLTAAGRIEVIQSPNSAAPATMAASTSQHHGDFDDDPATFQSLLDTILGQPIAHPVATAPAALGAGGTSAVPNNVPFQRSVQSCADQRRRLERHL